MRNEDLIIVLDSFREELRTGNTLTRATIQAEVNRIDEKVDSIIKHQEWQNGKLENHEERLDEQEHCPANRVMKILDKKVFWVAFSVVFIGVIVLTIWMYSNIDVHRTIENQTGIELIDGNVQ